MILDVQKLTLKFGGLTAVNELSFDVPAGQIVSLIGPNGAGKTSAFNAITGIYAPTAGSVFFMGRETTRPWSWRIGLGIGLVGAVCAIVGLIVFSNLNSLWSSVVSQPFSRKEFAWKNVPSSLSEYWFGPALQVVPTRDGWSVVGPGSTDGRVVFGKIPLVGIGPKSDEAVIHASDLVARRTAEELLTALDAELRNHGAGAIEPFRADPRFRGVLSTSDVERYAAETSARHRLQIWGALAGAIVGAFGTYSVWNRGRRSPSVCADAGMARTFQNIRLFRQMTVRENVLVGLDDALGGGLLSMALRLPAQRRREADAARRADEVLAFVGLSGQAKKLAGSLPYGDQRRLEIARALATDPKLLLLDEPGAGMNPAETADLIELIRKIRDGGRTILLIEHHMNVVMGISDKIVVLEYGRKIASGAPAEVRENPQVIEAYLGKDEE